MGQRFICECAQQRLVADAALAVDAANPDRGSSVDCAVCHLRSV